MENPDYVERKEYKCIQKLEENEEFGTQERFGTQEQLKKSKELVL